MSAHRAAVVGRFLLLLCAAWLWGGEVALAQAVLAVPPLTGHVVDQAGLLSPAQHGALDAKLAALEQGAGSQVAVLAVPTTRPEDIAAFAQRVGDQWKVGRRGVGDGLLLVVARDDRKVRIEVAKALEGAIPDLMAKRIIDERITPAFKAGDYAGGLNAAVDAIAARIRGEGLPAPSGSGAAPQGGGDGVLGDIEGLMVFLFVAVPIAGVVFTGILGRKLGALATGAGAGGLGWLATSSLVAAGLIGVGALVMVGVLGLGAAHRGSIGGSRRGGPVIWTGGGVGVGGWSSGSSSSSDSGGGFSSGGGGDFGGGGASGDW